MSTCAITGNKTIADLLYCANCDLNLTNQKGETPLFVATKNRNLVMVEFLIYCNCRVAVGDENDSTEMIVAAELGYTEILKFLMEHACKF
jgi:ankyrin repeat protein